MPQSQLTVVASTHDTTAMPWPFASFGPFVPAMSEAGEVAFQATLAHGGTGVFVAGPHRTPRALLTGGILAGVTSHPDLNRAGDLCFYGDTADGNTACFFRSRTGELRAETGATHGIVSAGPAGPTMNEAGLVAFRAEGVGRGAGVGDGVFILDGDGVHAVHLPGNGEVHGLPVADEDGRILYRHDLADGNEAIVTWRRGGSPSDVVRTGGTFASLGRFPATGRDGLICFTGTLRSGGSGVYFWRAGTLEQVVVTGGIFESIRGALVDGTNRVVFYATPRGGTLGLYRGPRPVEDRILGCGDSYLGSSVVALALNPVSINRGGELALRVKLADGRELILRAES